MRISNFFLFCETFPYVYRDVFEPQSEFTSIMHEVRQIVQQIHGRVQSLETSVPPHVQLQQPVLFQDACGFRSPVHLDFINSWEAFEAVLKVRFKKRGLQVVEKKQYTLEDASSKREIDMTQPYEMCFFPGQSVNMDACFDEETGITNHCPGCQNVEKEALDQTVIWYVCNHTQRKCYNH
jgi:hypothetical protein